MNYFNTDIIRNHDYIKSLNDSMLDHYNFLLGLDILNDADRAWNEEQFAIHLCYDV